MFKHQILDLITNKPKHYTKLIKKNKSLMDWIEQNSLIKSDKFIEHIYSAVYQETNICPRNNVKKIHRFNDGWIGCGPANKCECTRETIKQTTIKSKSMVSDLEQKKINQKRKKSMIEKYGVGFNLQRSDVITKLRKSKLKPEIFSKLSDKNWLTMEYLEKKRTADDIASQLNTYSDTVAIYLRKHNIELRYDYNRSMGEKQVEEYIIGLGFIPEISKRNLIDRFEIDIFIPERNLAIEFNGLYWHSERSGKKDKNYHLNKFKECEKKGIQLITIWEDEWREKTDIIKSRIKNLLGCNEKSIGARHYVPRIIRSAETRTLLDTHHIQGFVKGSSAIGLYDGEILKSTMIIDLKKNYYEIVRFCSDGSNIPGAFSKLLKFWIKNNPSTKEIISFSDNSYSSGKLYKSAGFELQREIGPMYYVTDYAYRYRRENFMKRCLKKNYPKIYSENKTEREMTLELGFDYIWDCGKKVWILKI